MSDFSFHQHDHERDMGQDNACSHEHAHDHGYSHAHEHAHDHSHSDGDGYIGKLHIGEHEGALVASLKYTKTEDVDLTRDELANKMNDLALWVQEQGGTVGHIKAAVTGSGKAYTLSTTGGNVQTRERQGTAVQVDLAVIVFALDVETLRQKLRALFAEVLPAMDEEKSPLK